MSDLVQRLRDSVTQCRALDRSQLLEEAAAEIERLRLTDAERDAVCVVASAYAQVSDDDCRYLAATLRCLLERFP